MQKSNAAIHRSMPHGAVCAWAASMSLLVTGALLPTHISASTAVASTPANAAVAYLAARQAESGLWSTQTPREFMDTAAAIAGLDAHGDAQARMCSLRAKGALLLRLPVELRTTQDMTLELACAEDADGRLLLAARNADGGWGTATGQQSDVLDTLIAVNALLDAGVSPDDGWDTTVQFLVDKYGADGYWFLSDEAAAGKLELTARAVRTLRRLRLAGIPDPAGLDRCVLAAVANLRAAFRADGRFSLDAAPNASVSPLDTAEAYRALVLIDQPALYANALGLLESLQAQDGSWREPDKPAQDIYTTATVMQAFGAIPAPMSSPRADLMVLPSAILFAPGIPAHGDPVTITAVVFNKGDVVAHDVEVLLSYNDPRSGGVALGGLVQVGNIQPKGSANASVTLDTAPLAEGPLVFVQADPHGKVPESDLTNNIASRLLHFAGLPDATPPAGIDLFIDDTMITFNDEVKPPTVFMLGSPIVALGITIANLGAQAAGAFTVHVENGGTMISRFSVPGLAASKSVTRTLSWNPGAGSGIHELTVTVDPLNAIAETDKTNNTATVRTEVLGDVCAVRITDMQENPPPFRAYDTALLRVSSAYTIVQVQLVVSESASSKPALTRPMPLFTAGHYQWNVADNPPGFYTATAAFTDADTGAVVDTVGGTFEVLETVALRGMRVSLPKNIVEGGALDPIPITVTFQNGSNVDADWQVAWRLLDPNGVPVVASTVPETVTILGRQMSLTVPQLAEEISGTISAAGRYTVSVTAVPVAGGEAVTGAAHFGLLPPLHLRVTNRVLPDEVAPLGKVRVRTVLKLAASGEASGLNVPAAIGQLTVSPSGNIPDQAASSVAITASGIVNAIGEILPTDEQGAQILVYVPYGAIGNGNPTAEAPDNAQVRVVDIVAGQALIDWSPVGNTLGANQYSLTVMEFRQYHPGEQKWYGKNIGTAEIFLVGQ